MPKKPTTPKTDAKPGVKKAGPAMRRGPGAAAKAKAANAAVVADTWTEAAPVADGAVKAANVLRLKDLVERVAAATGAKKKGVKEIVEAVLKEMGAALELGHSLNLPGFGKARVARPQGAEDGTPMTVKLRRGPGPGAKAKAGTAALAEAEDQD